MRVFKLTTNKLPNKSHSLPNIEDILAQLSVGCVFSKLDRGDAYYQLQFDEETKDSVVINARKEFLCYKVEQFGVASTPAVLPRETNKTLQKLKAVYYLDSVQFM